MEVREVLSDKVTLEQKKPEGSEEASPCDNFGEGHSRWREQLGKAPEVGTSLMGLKISEAGVDEAEQGTEREKVKRPVGLDDISPCWSL